jgi:hypothetical protein
VTGVDSASTRLTVPVSRGVGLEFMLEFTVELVFVFVVGLVFVLMVLFMIVLLLWSLLFGSFGFALRVVLVRCARVLHAGGTSAITSRPTRDR